MKKRYRKKIQWGILFSLLLFFLIAAWMVNGVRNASVSSRREGLAIAEQAVRKAAVSCYALDGVYPESYEELKKKSGISVEEGKYVVFYEVFASNIMPEITVIERGEDVP